MKLTRLLLALLVLSAAAACSDITAPAPVENNPTMGSGGANLT